MADKHTVIVDGNAAVAHVAHATNEVIAIYPITPSSPMGELSDEFSAKGRKNIWGTVPHVVEMQSEAGAAGTVHGALSTGALTTTFTASQGLLLMIPNMFKIAGELTPTVFHIAARAIATQGLSIFGDHSDVMAARSTGFAMLASNSVQEAMDMALVAQAATLESRVPFLHFFDGFRTSHEVQKIEEIPMSTIRALIKDEFVHAHRARALDPERPTIKGTSQNPDVYFASRETVNNYYLATPAIVQRIMDELAGYTGRKYKLFEYFGAPDADRVIVLMGSGAETMEEAVEYLNGRGEKVGILKVRLYRPFSADDMVAALPASVKALAVLDRTKEPGSLGEPLYEDVRTAISQALAAGKAPFQQAPVIVGGRYGLGSAEFTPSMGVAIFGELRAKSPKNNFTIGIYDDKSGTSLPWDEQLQVEADDVFRGVFFGLGSDGTVGANKNSIKIIGDATPNYAQGYFVYDSKKAGTVTVSHVRFGKRPIRSAYLISDANFVACHKFSFLEKVSMLHMARKNGTFLLASPYPAESVWDEIPVEVQKQIIDKNLRFYVIDALSIAEEMGMGNRINVIMQTAFFKISGVLPEDQAVQMIKDAIVKTYSKKGRDIVDANIRTVDASLSKIREVNYPKKASSKKHMLAPVPETAPKFVRDVIGEIMANRGDKLPVSALPDDGTFPVGTTKYEKRNIAEMLPVWDPETCIQCGDCSAVCPHATIRMKVYDPAVLTKAPATLKSAEARGKDFPGMKFTIQVAPEDCTACGACVNICPAFAKDAEGNKTSRKALVMEPQAPLREAEAANWEFFLNEIPNIGREKVNTNTTKGTQLLEPLFEFSGACAGCGETPYVKLLSQLYGDRAVIANATGCSSIYGGNLPTTPYTTRKDGRGPAWSNSLFEDAAEFGFGFRMTADKMFEYGRELLQRAKTEDPAIPATVIDEILSNNQETETLIEVQRQSVAKLKSAAEKSKTALAKELLSVADYLIKKSVWILGGDGWAYDIGFGGLDHVLASGRNVNVLVLDTEVYSNTGGQMSKATPTGAIAKFAFGGKAIKKKDLGAIAMSYGYVYVAKIAMGYNRIQTIKAFQEAEAYPGPSLIIAYSHCVAHGIRDMGKGMDFQKNIVNAGMFPLYRYNPQLAEEGKNPFTLDSKEPSYPLEDYLYDQIRFKSLKASHPDQAAAFLEQSKKDVQNEWRQLKYLADRPF